MIKNDQAQPKLRQPATRMLSKIEVSGLEFSHVLAFLALISIGAAQKRCRNFFLAIFDTPLPHVGILTLIYLVSNF